jgi:hypothetical protein
MPLPPPRDHRIPLQEAATLIRNHRANAAGGTGRGGMFHAKAVLDLLAQPGCVGLRYYYGRNGDGTPSLILVAVDADGDDMTGSTLLEFSYPCPPFCATPNDLADR